MINKKWLVFNVGKDLIDDDSFWTTFVNFDSEQFMLCRYFLHLQSRQVLSGSALFIGTLPKDCKFVMQISFQAMLLLIHHSHFFEAL